MGREINLEANSRLNLQDAAALSSDDYRILKAAFERCEFAVQPGGVVLLDAMMETATEAGYRGTAEQAVSILKVEGGFHIELGPSGRLAVRRSNYPPGSSGGNSAHG